MIVSSSITITVRERSASPRFSPLSPGATPQAVATDGVLAVSTVYATVQWPSVLSHMKNTVKLQVAEDF